jgi:alcohol dehydrogenase class IV
VCAALLPRVIAANIRAMKAIDSAESSRGLARYARVGRNLPGYESASDTESLEACVQFTSELSRELNIPPLKQFGIRAEDVAEMVGLARKSSSMRYNPIVLSDEVLAGVLKATIG